ncbi:MAG: DUF2798 domain-containing protein [Pelagibacteraceae bacterium]|jgi:hypothetical protein
MFSKKYYSIIFVFFISLGMSIFMSCIITIVNTGIDSNFILRWFKAWVVAFPLAFLAGNFFSPISKKITDRLTSG